VTIPIRGDPALELTGMVSSHAEVFAKVANGSDCVILSRAVGTVTIQHPFQTAA
jgi:hypothetical protein